MAERTSVRNASGAPVIRFGQAQGTGDSTILRLPDDASAKLPSRGQVANASGFKAKRLSVGSAPGCAV